jgi:hypothetical protein
MALPLAVRLFLDEPKWDGDTVGNLAHMVCLEGASRFLSDEEYAAMQRNAITVAARRVLLSTQRGTLVYAYIARIALRPEFQCDKNIDENRELQVILTALREKQGDIDDIGDNQVLQDILTCVGEQQQADKRNYNSVISRKCPEQLLQLPFSVATGDLQISDINPTDYIQTLELPTFTAAWLDAAVRRACMCVHEMSAPQAPS